MNINYSKLCDDLTGDEDFVKGDVHQAILNLGYNEWQREENKKWKYDDMTSFVRFQYGDVAEMMVLLGKWNQQVTNGGAMQYHENNYSGRGGGCFGKKSTACGSHHRMMELMQEYQLDKTLIGGQVYRIMEEFLTLVPKLDADCDYDSNEDGDHDVLMEELHQLDTEYYSIDDEWMKFLNNYITKWVTKGIDPMSPEVTNVSALNEQT